MAQVDLGSRVNRSQRLLALNSMSYAVARALLTRAGQAVDAESYLHAANQPSRGAARAPPW